MTYCVYSLNVHKRTFHPQHPPHPTPECCTENLNSSLKVLVLQALTIIPQEEEEVISDAFKGLNQLFYTQ